MSDGLSRRQLLARLGAGGAVAALAGCPGGDETESPTRTLPEDTPPDTETDRPDRTDTPTPDENVVNIEEAGASPDGDESILPVLESVPTDDVTLYFPPGEYFMDDNWRLPEFQNLRIEGPRATIRPATNLDGALFGLGSDDATGLTITGLTFDVRGENRGPRPIYGMVSDGLSVQNVTVAGRMDLEQDGMRFDVTDPEGSGVVQGLSMPDGGTTEYRVTGVFVGETHRGHLTFDGCYVAGFPDNGLYASPAQGRVNVVGGQYENSGVSNVRVSGPATVRNVTVRCDRSDRNVPNMRGIRLREGSDVLVRDCEVNMEAVTGSDGAIVCAPWLDEATIRDTEVNVSADGVPAMWAKRPTDEYAPERTHPLQLRNLQVSGQAGYGSTMTIDGRSDSLLEDVTICQPGMGRDGVRLINAGRAILRSSQVAVSGDPLVYTGAQITREGSTFRQIDGDEDC